MESPTQTLSRLNQLFTYYENTNIYCKSLPKGLTLRNFTKFPIPKPYQLMEEEFVHSGHRDVKFQAKRKDENLKIPDSEKNFQSLRDLRIYNQNAKKYRRMRLQGKKQSSTNDTPLSHQVSPRGACQKSEQVLHYPAKLARQSSIYLRRNAKFEAQLPNSLHSPQHWVVDLRQKFDNHELRQQASKKSQTQLQEWLTYHDSTYRKKLVNLDLSKSTQNKINSFHQLLQKTLKD